MERKAIFFNAKVEPVKPINEEFTLCKVYVCALDKNRNITHIGKEAADDALPTLYNCPVIGHIYVDDKGEYHMGGHDTYIDTDKDGNLVFRSMCVPYGVIPQQDNVHYEEIVEANTGKKRTYIVADCILWTGRFDCLREVIYSDDCWFGQSMEINVKEYAPLKEDENYIDILKYSYSALCLLGKSDNADYHVEPCFPESKIVPYEFALDNAQFTDLMGQLKSELASCFVNTGKGGNDMDNENVVVEEAEVQTKETVVFEETPVEEVVAEEPVEPVAETEAAETTEPEETPAEEETVEKCEFSSTYREKQALIQNALPEIREEDEDGSLVHCVNYWCCDFDDAFVYVEKDEFVRDEGWSQNKGRFAYEFNADEKTVSINGEFEAMYVRWLTKEEVDQIEDQRSQFEELKNYKSERERVDREAEFDAAIEEFSYLKGNEEYEKVFEARYGYESIDALKDACYIVKGKYSISAPAQKKTNEPSVPVAPKVERNIYDDFFARFGRKN